MRVAFRTDVSSQIGTGHFMRCLALADELKKQRVQIRFVSRDLSAHLRDMLDAKDMECVSLSTSFGQELGDELAHSDWLGNSQAQDAQATTQALADHMWDWVVVDHYALDVRWESAIRASTKKIMVIDDLADREHGCDVLLDQNFYVDMLTRYNGKVPEHCQLLLGPRYALLREEFRKFREQLKPRTGAIKRILVSFGGVDAGNYTGLTLEALTTVSAALPVEVIIGAQHPYREQIQHECARVGYTCYVQTARMAELMAEADLAIGAGGTAMWERCCLGLPSIVLCVADNQRKQIVDAAESGLLYTLTSANNLLEMIGHHINSLLENPTLLKLISNTGMKMVDGKGATRAVRAMSIGDIEIRQATKCDSQYLFEWRNHPTIRAASKSDVTIAWEDHQRWLDMVVNDRDRELLIGISDNKPIGVVRFDKKGDVAEVSIYLVPDGEFFGQGRNLLLAAECWLKANRSDIKSILASVLTRNEASKNLFLDSNYLPYLTCFKKYF
jgi:UDP-2,4-diacetamido-2,4,6-trideoxy-beta-L-altropyranose hydrolase